MILIRNNYLLNSKFFFIISAWFIISSYEHLLILQKKFTYLLSFKRDKARTVIMFCENVFLI